VQSPFPTFWVYRDDKGSWRWKFAVAEGEFSAESSGHYSSPQDCAQAIKHLQASRAVAIFGSLEDLEAEASPLAPPRNTQGRRASSPLSDDDKVDWGSPVVDVTAARR
jgi:uncharacterized protein YegP (UPF0339 family)